MTTQEMTLNPEIIDQGDSNGTVKRILIGAGLVGIMGGAAVACSSGEGTENASGEDAPAGGEFELNAFCEEASIVRVSANPNEYDPKAFLPLAEGRQIGDNQEVEDYLGMIFEEGPLGTSIDTVSLSALMAALTLPAHDGATVDQETSFLNDFALTLASYRAEGGEEAARRDCQLTYDTMRVNGQYEENWAQDGEEVTRLTPIRDIDADSEDAWRLEGMKIQGVTVRESLSGIAFQLRSGAREEGMDAFTEVLITGDGRLYIKGAPTESGAVTIEDVEDLVAQMNEENDNGGSDRGGRGPHNGQSGGEDRGDCGGSGCGGDDCGDCPGGSDGPDGPGGGDDCENGCGGDDDGPTPTNPTVPPPTNPPPTNPTVPPPTNPPPTNPPPTNPPPTQPTVPPTHPNNPDGPPTNL